MEKNDWIEQIIKQVAGSMAIEGVVLTEEDKERIRLAAEGPEVCKKIIQALIQKHTVKGTGNGGQAWKRTM